MSLDIITAALSREMNDDSRAELYLRLFPFIVHAARLGILDFQLTVMPLGAPEHASTPAALAEVPEERGLTFKEFAERVGIDRRTVGKCVVVLALGEPVPPLKPGQIPARRIGNTTRIFMQDVWSAIRPEGDSHAHHREAAPGTAQGARWRGPLDQLLRRRGFR